MPNPNAAASADRAAAGLIMAPRLDGEVLAAPRARFDFECVGPDGAVKWADHFHNVVTTVGKVAALDIIFGATAKPSWYLVLKGAGAAAVGDTLASHAAWTELTPYAGGNRPAVTFNAASANTTNGRIVSTQVAVSINATATVAGAGLCVTQSNASTAGTLYNAGDFAVARSVAENDQLNVTITLDLS